MMVDDDDVGLCRLPARLEEKALIVELALEPRAQVRLGRDLVPQLGSRRCGQIAQRTVSRALGPVGDRLQLVALPIIEERARRGACLLEPLKAEVIAPPLEKREANALVGQRLGEKRQILADE